MKRFASNFSDGPLTFWIAGGLLALSFAIRLIALYQTEFANGWDSYFYLVQLQSLKETGALHTREWTLLYPLLWGIDLFSPDYITSVKVLSAILATLFAATVFILSNRIQSSRWVSLAVLSYTVFSPELTYFAAQWPKNLLGVTILIVLLLALWKRKWRSMVILLILGFFGHRMTALLGLGIVALTFFVNHVPSRFRIALAAGIIVCAVAGLVVPGVLKVYDFQRLNDLIAGSPQFPILTFYRIFGTAKISLLWQFELWFTFGVAITVSVRLIIRREKHDTDRILTLIALLFVLWFPFYHWDTGSAAYRFFHVGILLTPVLLIFLLPAKRLILYGSFAMFTATSFFSWKAYDPETQDPPYALYKIVTEQTRQQIKPEDKPQLIIAHKSLAEYYSFTTKSDAMAWLPEARLPVDRVWRIAVLPYPQLYSFYTNRNPAHLIGQYYFIPEHEWRLFITELQKHEHPDVINEHLTWKNPNEVRPAFLQK